MQTLSKNLFFACTFFITFGLGIHSELPQAKAGKKKSGKKTRKSSKTIKVPPQPRVRIPSVKNLPIFHLKNIKPYKPIQKSRAEKLKRPPTRGRNPNMRSLQIQKVTKTIKSASPVAQTKQRKRTQTAFEDVSAPHSMRLTVHHRKLGRFKWYKAWLGHVVILPKGRIRIISPLRTYSKRLRKAILEARSKGIRYQKPRVAHKQTKIPQLFTEELKYAKRLQKFLETKKLYEVKPQLLYRK